MTGNNDKALALPEQRNLAVLRDDAGRLVADLLPRWLTSTLALEHHFPLPLEGPALEPLAAVARYVLSTGHPVQDYLVEILPGEKEALSLLIKAERADSPRAEVLIALMDVTDVVRQRRRAAAIGSFHGLIGQSLPMLDVYQKIATYGPTDAAVLITGETGTGKELVARSMHERSNRQDHPFVAVNCSALTPELFESELFGHEKGSFTGAYRQHRGRFERADGGTLFLDEIGDMPPMTQAKMLRALEEGTIERVGGEGEKKVDVRVVASTNVALEQAVQQRRFRADLYHRLSVLRVHVPPLREREGDVPLLVDHFLQTFNRRYQKNVRKLTREALTILEEYHWPGNVRELRNVIERLVIETESEAIGAKALAQWQNEREFLMPGSWNADSFFMPRAPIIAEPEPFPIADPPRAGDQFWGARPPARQFLPSEPLEVVATPLDRKLPEPEPEPVELTADAIQQAFRDSRGNLTRAAARLGVHKATLYRHMKRLGISRESLEQEANP